MLSPKSDHSSRRSHVSHVSHLSSVLFKAGETPKGGSNVLSRVLRLGEIEGSRYCSEGEKWFRCAEQVANCTAGQGERREATEPGDWLFIAVAGTVAETFGRKAGYAKRLARAPFRVRSVYSKLSRRRHSASKGKPAFSDFLRKSRRAAGSSRPFRLIVR